MPSAHYRCYSLDGASHFHDAEWINAASDDDARRQVEAKFANAICEIWQGNRLVARITPDRLTAV